MSALSVNEWLDYFGFVRHPFVHDEAAGEAAAWAGELAERLVKPNCFDRVLGQASDPRSVVVFAPRGGGKTACRVLLDYYAREGIGQGDRSSDETGGRILPVLHTRLYEVVRQADGDVGLVDEHMHVLEILRRATSTLVELLQGDVQLAERLRRCPFEKRVDIQWFFYVYPTYLSTEQFRFLREDLELRAFKIGASERGLGFLAEPTVPRETSLSPEISGLLQARLQMPPIDQLQLFTELIEGLGFRALYVIVDGLDELRQTADLSSHEGAMLVEPLLTNLTLMTNIPRLAFKFFIPAELDRYILLASRRVRKDRLVFEHINWTSEGLRGILRRRLAVSSRGHVIRSLDAVSVPELRGRIENVLIDGCQKNPRYLIWLARFLIAAHCDGTQRDTLSELEEEAFLLNPSDLKRAITRFRSEILGEQEPPETLQHVPSPTPKIVDDGATLKNYPAPIALVHLDYTRRIKPIEQVQRLLDLFEVTVAFIGIVLLSQLQTLADSRSARRLRSRGLRLDRMSLGGWLAVWERVSSSCSSLGDKEYGRRFQRLFHRQRERLEAFRQLRNSWAHGATQSHTEYVKILDHYGPEMTQLLAALQFLRDFKLVRIESLRLVHSRHIHQARVYMDDNPNFPWEEIEWERPLPSEEMLLLGQQSALSLHPLLVYESCPECHQPELFMYQQVEDEQVVYLSYHTGHRLTMDRCWQILKERLRI